MDAEAPAGCKTGKNAVLPKELPVMVSTMKFSAIRSASAAADQAIGLRP